MKVLSSLEVVGGIVVCRKCARAKLAVQLRERYKRLITRERVAFNFTPRSSLSSIQAAGAMRTERGAMIDLLLRGRE